MDARAFGSILPDDAPNRRLVDHVHPPGWVNPTPSGRYHLAVVGAGTAGLVTAAIAASLGARVALIERHLMGGDCLNVGCVPSKAVLAAAKRVHAARAAAALGMGPAPGAEPDFAAAMRRMREIRAGIGREDSAARYAGEFGVHVHLGEARFTARDRLEVAGRELRFRRAVVATGARAAAPAIPGLAEAGYRTNETIFELTERPGRLAVIGGGPIGCELAQAFARLGVRVHLLEQGAHVLEREDDDAAELVQRALARDGVELVLGCRLERVEARGDARRLHLKRADGRADALEVDELLVAAGRAPNVEGLGLEAAGVAFDSRGVQVDDRLRTTNGRIYAAGDVCMAWKFTHAADAAAKIVVQNALFGGRRKLSSLVMPWCTYTDPELAHVGLSEREAAARGLEVDRYTTPFAKVNRAATDGEEEGFAKVLVRKGTDRILGATIVGSHAGELVSLVTLAMSSGRGLGTFGSMVYPYPTLAEALKVTAGAYTRTRLTPLAKRLFALWFRLTGSRL
jgi:pyruvate/2-oxoglutarate dehydrogenase complex dihydrolipoamide dehydrogenase (E3) component